MTAATRKWTWIQTKLQSWLINLPVPAANAELETEDNRMEGVDDRKGKNDSRDSEDNNSVNDDEGGDVETNLHILITAESKHSRIHHLTNLPPKVFSESQPEEYMPHHRDLSGSNILVDADHHLSGILDRE